MKNEDEINLHLINTIATIDLLITQLRAERNRLNQSRTDRSKLNPGNLADY